MCFSASASFVSATVIGSLGVLAHKRVRHKSEKALASIPVLFAIQQVFEGFIWLSFNHQLDVAWRPGLTAGFLFFAWVVWPILVPFASYSLEQNSGRKKVFKWLLVMGALIATVSLIQIGFAHPEAYEIHARLAYRLKHNLAWPSVQYGLQLVYIIVTLLPLLLSTFRGIFILGVTNMIALLISFLFFNEALPSVWCFFAALLSFQIVAMLPIKKDTRA